MAAPPYSPPSASLADAKENEQDRSEDADLFVGREQADGEGRAAHQADRGEESGLAADPVAHRPEDDRAKRPECKADREQRQRGNQGRSRVEPCQEYLRNNRRQRTEDEEIIPFERRPADDAVTTLAIDHLAGCDMKGSPPKLLSFRRGP
jgi:hypothetical protein